MAKTLAELIDARACSAKESQSRMAIQNAALRMALEAAIMRLNELEDNKGVSDIRDILESAA